MMVPLHGQPVPEQLGDAEHGVVVDAGIMVTLLATKPVVFVNAGGLGDGGGGGLGGVGGGGGSVHGWPDASSATSAAARAVKPRCMSLISPWKYASGPQALAPKRHMERVPAGMPVAALLTAARALVLADGKVKPEESALLKKVAAALG